MRKVIVLLVVAVGLLLASCVPVPPPPGAPSGCGEAVTPELRDERFLHSDGVVRDYLLSIPADYDASIATPLVFNLHGNGSNAIEQSFYTSMDERGTARGFIVVTPNGIDGRWDLTAPSTDFTFLNDLRRYLGATLCIDDDRTFSTGMSLGGAMTSALACRAEMGLDGIATVTAMLPACAPGERPIPTLSFHGTADAIVPYGPVEGVVATWAARNGCTTPRQFRIEPDIVRHKYRGCDRRSSTVLYTVEGGGHTWPDGLIDLPQFGPTTRTINATDLILDLFASV